jgi:hypothetical protein
MPLKAYVIGIVDAFQGQMQTLERCMGIPTEYCLISDEANISPTATTPGLFTGAP